jgi:hypothetical protein
MGAGASFNARDDEDVDDTVLVSELAEQNTAGDPRQSNENGLATTSSTSKKVVLVGVFLRDPTHNVPDKFHSNFFVESNKGALIKGNR